MNVCISPARYVHICGWPPCRVMPSPQGHEGKNPSTAQYPTPTAPLRRTPTLGHQWDKHPAPHYGEAMPIPRRWPTFRRFRQPMRFLYWLRVGVFSDSALGCLPSMLGVLALLVGVIGVGTALLATETGAVGLAALVIGLALTWLAGLWGKTPWD